MPGRRINTAGHFFASRLSSGGALCDNAVKRIGRKRYETAQSARTYYGAADRYIQAGADTAGVQPRYGGKLRPQRSGLRPLEPGGPCAHGYCTLAYCGTS